MDTVYVRENPTPKIAGHKVQDSSIWMVPGILDNLNSHYFHWVGEGHKPNSLVVGLYTHYRDFREKEVGWVYPQYKELIGPGTWEPLSVQSGPWKSRETSRVSYNSTYRGETQPQLAVPMDFRAIYRDFSCKTWSPM